MKLFHTTVLFWFLLLTSCIGENRDECPPNNNLLLRLSYTNDGDSNLFRERIQQTDLFFFDEAGYFVGQQTINTDQLDENQSIAISVKPGIYRMVSWGHLLERTGLSPLIPDTTRIEDSYIFNNTLEGNTAASGDIWYYAPRPSAERAAGYRLTIPTSGMVTQNMNFTSAHVRVEIYIEGFTDTDENGENRLPLIEINEHSTQVNFNKETIGLPVTYVQASSYETIQGSQMATAYFNLPPFNDDNPINIQIKKTDGTTIQTVIIKDYLTENNISVENSEEPVIPIYIQYDRLNVAVSISVPTWDESDVKPAV